MNLADRYYSIDVLKSFSIFGVVYIHGGHLLCNSAFTISSIYFRYSVPLFILITFFLAENSFQNHKEQDLKTTLKKRLNRLFIPFIFWSLLYFLLLFNGVWNPLKIITTHFAGYGWSGQYFFLILFQLTIINFIITKYIKVTTQLVIFIFLATILIYLLGYIAPFGKIYSLLGNRFGVFWVFYMVLGIWIGKHKEKIPFKLSEKTSYLILLILPLAFLIEDKLFTENNLSIGPYFRLSHLFICPILFFAGYSIKFKRPSWLNKLFATISTYSMAIFCLNPLVIILYDKTIKHFGLTINLGNESDYLIPFFTSLIILFTCLFIGKAIERMGGGLLVK